MTIHKCVLLSIVICLIMNALFFFMVVRPTVMRSMSLNKRAQILEQEIGKLDRRIKKQEGLKHGFGS